MNPETPTFNQMNEQLDAGHKDMTVLVDRSGEKISTGIYKGEKTSDGRYVVEVTASNGEKGYRTVTAEDLSDAAQADLAAELAGQPLNNEVSVDTVPRSEVMSSTEASESLATVEQHEGLGDVALESMDIEAPEQQNADKTPEEGAEQKTELPEAVAEVVSLFTRSASETLDALQVKTEDEMRLLDELSTGLNTLRYGQVPNKQALIQQQMDTVAELRAAFSQDADSGLRSLIIRFNGDLQEQVDAIRRSDDTADELRQKARLLSDAGEDIAMVGRSIDTLSEELADEIAGVMRTYDEFLYSNGWGDETYVAMLSQKLATVEDLLHSRRGRQQGLSNELPVLDKTTV